MGYTIYFDHSGAVSYTLPNLKETLHHDANIVNLGYDGADMLWMGQDRYGVLLYDLKNGTMTSGVLLVWERFLDEAFSYRWRCG